MEYYVLLSALCRGESRAKLSSAHGLVSPRQYLEVSTDCEKGLVAAGLSFVAVVLVLSARLFSTATLKPGRPRLTPIRRHRCLNYSGPPRGCFACRHCAHAASPGSAGYDQLVP